MKPLVATHQGGKYDYDILEFVAAGGKSQTEFAKKLGLKGSNALTRHVKRLKKLGYLNEGAGLSGGLTILGEAHFEELKVQSESF